jgi:hypothetical protein
VLELDIQKADANLGHQAVFSCLRTTVGQLSARRDSLDTEFGAGTSKTVENACSSSSFGAEEA